MRWLLNDGPLWTGGIRGRRPASGGTPPAPWSPLSLFAAGEQGVWYDPSDLTTLFQDHLGTIPAAYGQPVGLMLDKKSGGPGPELVVNGGSAAGDTQGWIGARGNESLSIVGGKLRVTAIAAGAFGASAAVLPLAEGDKMLRTSGSFSSPGVGTFTLRANVSSFLQTGNIVDVPIVNGAASRLTNTTLAAYVGYIGVAAAAGDYFEIGSISFKALPGNHASQPTVTARPTLMQDAGGRAYLDFDIADDFMSIPAVALPTGSGARSQSFRWEAKGTDSSPMEYGVAVRGQRWFTPIRANFSGVVVYTDAVSGALNVPYNAPITQTIVMPQGAALGAMTMRINGVADAFTGATTVIPNTVSDSPGYLGNLTTAKKGSRIYGGVMINRALSPAEVTQLEAYLGGLK